MITDQVDRSDVRFSQIRSRFSKLASFAKVCACVSFIARLWTSSTHLFTTNAEHSRRRVRGICRASARLPCRVIALVAQGRQRAIQHKYSRIYAYPSGILSRKAAELRIRARLYGNSRQRICIADHGPPSQRPPEMLPRRGSVELREA